jgi:glutaredoxin
VTKAWLSGKGISFTEFNVSTDVEAGARLRDLGYRSTPVVKIGDEYIVGYSPLKLEAACNTYGL